MRSTEYVRIGVSGQPMRSRSDSGRARSSGHSGLCEQVWRGGSHLTVTVGVMCSVVSWGWGTTLAEVLIFSFCTGFIAGGILAERGFTTTPKVVRVSLWCGLTIPALAGVVNVFGAAGVLLLLGLT